MQQWAFDTAAVCNISASRDPAAAAVWSGNTQHGYGGGAGGSSGNQWKYRHTGGHTRGHSLQYELPYRV